MRHSDAMSVSVTLKRPERNFIHYRSARIRRPRASKFADSKTSSFDGCLSDREERHDYLCGVRSSTRAPELPAGFEIWRRLAAQLSVTICSALNIHYPTDSTLLGDGLRVLTRGLVRIAAECRRGAVDVVDHGRAVKHRLLEISRAAKSLTAASRQRLQASYAKLVALTRGVVRQVKDVVARVASRRLRVVGNGVQVDAQVGLLRHYLPMVEQVITQTQARVWGGDRHVPEKILSLFEPHTKVIRKGKAHKPNEFGRLVRLDEVEHGIVSGYAVLDGNPADTNSFLPALDHHIASFGHAPDLATGDRGFFSAANERDAEARGVAKVALPARGPLSKTRAARQKQRWFRRALRWRAGCEATISTLKHPFSMARATYKGAQGFQRYVGWSVITKNLCAIARWQKGRTLKRRRRAAVG